MKTSHQSVLGSWGAMVLALPFAASAAEVRYRVNHFIEPSANCYCVTWPKAVNDAGHVTGYMDYYNLESFVPFITAAGAADVELLDQFESYGDAYGASVNRDGDFVGFASPNDSLAFLLHHEEGLRLLDGLPPGGQFLEVRGSNDSNQIVGKFRLGNFAHAFRWDSVNGVVDLGDLPGGDDRSEAYAINNAGVVVGFSDTGRGFREYEAFIWDEEDGMRLLGEPPGGLAIDAVYISDDGLVAGTAVLGNQYQPYLWTEQSGFALLGPMPGTNAPAWVQGGNSRGQVVGWGRSVFGIQKPFIADIENGVRDLQPLLDPCVADQHPDMRFAPDINDLGMIIIGDRSDNGALLLTPYLPGDLDDDRMVDLQDLATLLGNFSSSDANYADGDLDCDADVDLQDLATLLSNFESSLP